MARLWSSGFELNSVAAAVEWVGTPAGPTIVTTTVRTGTYSGRIPSLGSGTRKGFQAQFVSSVASGPYFFRCYYNFTTLPSAANTIMSLVTTTGGSTIAASITIDNTGALTLYNGSATTGTQIGSASSALSTGTWYCIELWYDRSPAGGSQILKARLDQSEFASATNLTITNQVLILFIGGNLNAEAQTTGDWYMDDVAINDATGGNQNSYPGSGKVLHLRPNAAGDSTQWVPDTGSNFARVNEVTPNDATSLVSDVVLNESDLYNVDNSGIGASDTVNVVQIGVRFRNDVADATTQFKVQVEKTSGGTLSQSAAITPNSTTWKTNALAEPRLHPLTLYADPDGAAWTQATLDTMQIGQVSTLIGVNKNQVSTIWAVIDYTPAAAGGSGNDWPGFQSRGFMSWRWSS